MLIREFSYILSIIEWGSYSKAAKALYISQPALSAYIHKLETQLNICFFENDSKKLTPEGELYVSYAKKIMELEDQLMNNLEQVKRQNNRVYRLGITTGMSEYILPAIYPSLKDKSLKLFVDIQIMHSSQLVEKLTCKELDLILIHKPIESMFFSAKKILSERMLFTIPKNNPILEHAYNIIGDKYRHLSPKYLHGQPMILLQKRHLFRSRIDKMFEQNHITPLILQETSNARTACTLAKAGYGITVLLDIVSEIELLGDDIECVYIDSPMMNIVYIAAYNHSMENDVNIRRIFQVIKSSINTS